MQEVKSNDTPEMKDCVVVRALWGASQAWRRKQPKDHMAWHLTSTSEIRPALLLRSLRLSIFQP